MKKFAPPPIFWPQKCWAGYATARGIAKGMG